MYNDMQLLKRQFFAHRNGVVADALRSGGSKFPIIFGLQLPDLSAIAAQSPHTQEFAQRLWDNSTTRESMLIAPMLMPREAFDKDLAQEWIEAIPDTEVADILCFKLLKHMPYAQELSSELIDSPRDLTRYTALRLLLNLLNTPLPDPEAFTSSLKSLAQAELSHSNSLTTPLCRLILSY